MSEKTLAEAMADSKNPKIPLDTYKLKILDAQLKIGQTGDKNKFIELKSELIGNPPKVIDGKEENVNGINGIKRMFLTEKSLSRLGKLHKQLGLPLDFTLGQILATPNTSMYVGGTYYAICQTKLSPKVKADGTPLLGSDGQQIVDEQFDIGDIA